MIDWQVLTFVSSAIAVLAIVLGTIIDLRLQAAYRKLAKEKRQLQKSNAELHDTVVDMRTSLEVHLAYEEKRNQELEQRMEMEDQAHSRSMEALEQKSLELQQKFLELQKRNQELEQANEYLQQAVATAAKPTLQQVMASETKKSRSRTKPTVRKTIAGLDNGASRA
jgi:ABC-type multidrug transport system fused ATPase/permease subunit